MTVIGFRLALCAATLPLSVGAAPDAAVTVAVLDRAVDKGAILSSADFIDGEMSPMQARGALRIRDVDGMEAARRLMAGSTVRSGDIVRPQLVRRGEPVTITLRSRTLVITSTGRALANAAAGETVRVVATSTNRTIDAVVEGPAAVRIASN